MELNSGYTIRKFMYYIMNFTSTQFQVRQGVEIAPTCFKAWEDDTSLQEHLIEKWQGMCRGNDRGGSQALIALYFELSRSNQDLLVDWIMYNYKGMD